MRLTDMPVGTPVNAHERSAGSVERRKTETAFSSLSVFQAAKWETRGYVRISEARKGVHNIVTMKNRPRRETRLFGGGKECCSAKLKKELTTCSA